MYIVIAHSCKSSLRSPNANNVTYLLSAGGRGCSALFLCPKSTKVSFGDPDSPHNLTGSLYKSQYLLNKHAAQRHVTNCSFDQTIAVNVICLSFACLFLFPASTKYPAGTPNLGGGVLATGRRRHKKRQPMRLSFFMVPVAGLEPARYHYRWILSPLRLPIPSHRHKLLNHSSTTILFLQLI